MSKVLAIVNPEVSRGFKFSGVQIKSTPSPELAKRHLLDALRSRDYGIIIIDEDYLSSFDEHTRHLVEESIVPLIVPVPLEMRWREKAARSDSYVQEMIRRAIGYHIKIR